MTAAMRRSQSRARGRAGRWWGAFAAAASLLCTACASHVRSLVPALTLGASVSLPIDRGGVTRSLLGVGLQWDARGRPASGRDVSEASEATREASFAREP